MKKIALIFFLLSLGFATKAQRPNIILIVADDLGAKDLGFMGGLHYLTPNLDSLAQQSHVYYQAYAPAANCAPSRASLITGLYTPKHGIYTVGSSERGDPKERKLVPIPNRDELDNQLPTIATFLKGVGYNTASIGKWHLSESPLNYSFDYNFGGNHKGHNKHFSPYQNPDILDAFDEEYLTDRVTDEAIKYMKQPKEENPFFVYLSYFAVHTPLEAPDSIVNTFKDKTEGRTKDYPVYAAMIKSLDNNIGRIVSYLRQNNQLENTIIIFTSDNGGINFISPQTPFRGGKGTYYEGGIRVPLIFHWPKSIPAYHDQESIVSLIDVLPTLNNILGIKSQKKLDGKILRNSLINKDKDISTLYWHYPIYLESYKPEQDESRDPKFRTRPGSALRYNNWKLQYFYEDNKAELYDLSNDLNEKKDLSNLNPKMTKFLLNKLNRWIRRINAPIPTELNPQYNIY